MEDLEVQMEACHFVDTEISCKPCPSPPLPYIHTTFPCSAYPFTLKTEEVASTLMLVMVTRLHDPVIFLFAYPQM
jgi:hypothetical protein